MTTSNQGPPHWFVVALTGLVPLHRRVLKLAAAGWNYGQIAGELGLSAVSVRRHAHDAMTALRPPA
ncbi:MAG: sigma factor-like helix-turn-helix DNA-binding protein [Mycobacteriales bacterium]